MAHIVWAVVYATSYSVTGSPTGMDHLQSVLLKTQDGYQAFLSACSLVSPQKQIYYLFVPSQYSQATAYDVVTKGQLVTQQSKNSIFIQLLNRLAGH